MSGTISIADVVATMKIVDEVSPVMRQVSQTSVSEIGKLQASVTAANAEVRGLAKSWQDFHESPRIQSGIEQELGAAVVKAQALSAQLQQTKKDIKDALTTPPTTTAGGSLTESLTSATTAGGAFTGMLTTATAALGAYVSIRGVLGAAEASAEFGLNIERLSQQLGMSTDAIQILNFASIQTAVPMNTITAAVTQLQRKLSLEDGGAIRALNDLGLSFEAVRAMQPEQQFATVADALAKVTDQSKFAGFAAELFNSRSGTSISAVIRNYEDLKTKAEDANVVLSHGQVEAIADVAKWWETAKLKAEAYGAAALAAAVTPVTRNAHGPKDANGFYRNDLDSVLAQQQADILATLPNPLATLPGLAVPNLGDDKQGLANMKELDLTATRLNQTARESIALHKQQAAEAAKYNESLLELAIAESGYAGILDNVDGTVIEAIKYDVEHHAKLEDIVRVYGVLPQVVRGVQEELKFENSVTDATNKQFGDHVQIMGTVKAAYGDLHGQITGLNEDGTLFATTLGDDLNDKVDNFGSRIDLASHSAHSFLLAMRAMKDEASPLGEALDATLNDLPKIIERSFEGGGGVDGVFKAGGADLGKHFAGSIKTTIGDVLPESMNNAIGGAVGSVLGGVGGALISQGIGKLMSLITNIGGPSAAELAGRKTEGDFEQQMGGWQGIQKALLATGLTADQVNAKIQALWAAETQGASAVAAQITGINNLLNDQKQDDADLQAAIQQYGFTVDQLGPTMQKQQLTQQAQTLENQWRLLVGSGIDMTLVTDKMSSSLNDYLHLAMKTGQEVPLEMKPIIDQMIKQGDLTDANGNKITDLGESGLTFSETFSQGVDRIVDSLNKLLAGLGLLPSAAAAAASGITNNLGNMPPIDIHYRFDTDGGPIPMASGGDFMVNKPTLFLAGEAGPERATFSGAGRTSMPGSEDHLKEMRAMHATLKQKLAFIESLPDDMARAVKVAMQFG
jgi:hypothetical protein